MGHFVLSPREREKRDRRVSRGDERKGLGRKRNRNESEETEEIKHSPSTLTCYKDSRPCPSISQYQLDAPVTKIHDTFATPDHPMKTTFLNTILSNNTFYLAAFVSTFHFELEQVPGGDTFATPDHPMKTTFLNTILSNNTFYLAAFVSTFHFELEQVPGGGGWQGGGGGHDTIPGWCHFLNYKK